MTLINLTNFFEHLSTIFYFSFFFFWHNFISIIIVILNQKVISHSSKITNFGVYMNQENNLLHENNTFQFTDWLLRLIVKSSFEMRIRQENEYCVCIHFSLCSCLETYF